MAISKGLTGNRVINGTYGHCIINGEELSACKSLQAKLDVDTEEIFLPDKFIVDNTPIKATGKGSVTLYKIDSFMHKLIGEKLKNGEPFSCEIITQLKDPKSYGSEAYALTGVYFTDLTIADWERAKTGEIECPFVFSDFDAMDLI